METLRQKFEIYEKEGVLVIYAYNLSKETKDKLAALLLNDVHTVSSIPDVEDGLDTTFDIPENEPVGHSENSAKPIPTNVKGVSSSSDSFETTSNNESSVSTPVPASSIPEDICMFDAETEDSVKPITNMDDTASTVSNEVETSASDTANEDEFAFNPEQIENEAPETVSSESSSSDSIPQDEMANESEANATEPVMNAEVTAPVTESIPDDVMHETLYDTPTTAQTTPVAQTVAPQPVPVSDLKALDTAYVHVQNENARNTIYKKIVEWAALHEHDVDVASIRQYLIDGKHTLFTMLSKGMPDEQYESMIHVRKDEDILRVYQFAMNHCLSAWRSNMRN